MVIYLLFSRLLKEQVWGVFFFFLLFFFFHLSLIKERGNLYFSRVRQTPIAEQSLLGMWIALCVCANAAGAERRAG